MSGDINDGSLCLGVCGFIVTVSPVILFLCPGVGALVGFSGCSDSVLPG